MENSTIMLGLYQVIMAIAFTVLVVIMIISEVKCKKSPMDFQRVFAFIFTAIVFARYWQVCFSFSLQNSEPKEELIKLFLLPICVVLAVVNAYAAGFAHGKVDQRLKNN
ncbi:MAG: hypothetical protein WCX97_03670 [Candidatus Magasanikbacteria bacterium]